MPALSIARFGLIYSLVVGITPRRTLCAIQDLSKLLSPESPGIGAATTTIVEVVGAEENLSSMSSYISASGLVDLLSRPAFPYTLFAPTNEAFDEADGFVSQLQSPDWKAHLRAFVKAHIYRGPAAILAVNITDGMVIPTFGSFYMRGDDVMASVNEENGTIALYGEAFNESVVVEADLLAGNGVVHKVDRVFIPKSLTLDIFETTSGFNGDVDTARALVTMVGLEETLRTETLTVFFPTNAAFEALSSEYTSELLDDLDRLNLTISNHIIRGVWHKDMLTEGLQLTSLAGENMTFSVGTGYFADHLVNEAILQATDLVASNGIVHIVDSILFPRNESDTAPPAEEPSCSICVPGMVVSKPDKIVLIPDGFIDGLTEGTCDVADFALRNNPSGVLPAVCGQLQANFKEDCGCIPRNFSTGFNCSVCEPGLFLSKPDAVVDIPEGITEGFSQATCGLMNSAVMENPSLFTEETCTTLRELYRDECGCIISLEDTPTAAPNEEAPSTEAPPVAEGGCTICEPGKEIRKPDRVVVIPAGFILEDDSFATCALLERALIANPDTVDTGLCIALRDFYKEPCKCRTIKVEEPQPSPPTSTPTTDTSSAIELRHFALVMVTGLVQSLVLV